MRFLIENFVTSKDAQQFINFFSENSHLCRDAREAHANRNLHYSDIKNPSIRKLLDYYANKTIFFIDHYFKTKSFLWQPMRLCRWKKGENMNMHTDREDPDNMDFSSLTYLNDDYKGGELCFENESFKMKALSSIIFESGGQNSHRVETILKGRRYTIPSWYKKCS